MADWKTILVLSNRIEAEIAAGLLNQNDIMTNIVADDLAGTNPELDISLGVKLQVPDDDADQALQLLKTQK